MEQFFKTLNVDWAAQNLLLFGRDWIGEGWKVSEADLNRLLFGWWGGKSFRYGQS